MHNASPQSTPLTIGRTVLKKSDDLVILEVTFYFKLTLRSIFAWFPEQLLKDLLTWGSPGECSMTELLERCFQGFVLPVLEYCSAVWCSAADTHLKLQDCAVSSARFLTGGVFECDIALRRSVAVPCMLYEIRWNPIHLILSATLCRLQMVPWSHMGILMRHLTAEPRNTTGLLFPSQGLSGMILLTPHSMV